MSRKAGFCSRFVQNWPLCHKTEVRDGKEGERTSPAFSKDGKYDTIGQKENGLFSWHLKKFMGEGDAPKTPFVKPLSRLGEIRQTERVLPSPQAVLTPQGVPAAVRFLPWAGMEDLIF